MSSGYDNWVSHNLKIFMGYLKFKKGYMNLRQKYLMSFSQGIMDATNLIFAMEQSKPR